MVNPAHPAPPQCWIQVCVTLSQLHLICSRKCAIDISACFSIRSSSLELVYSLIYILICAVNAKFGDYGSRKLNVDLMLAM